MCKCIEIVLISFNNLLLPTLLTYIYIYMLLFCIGDDPKLIYRFVNPTYLSEVSKTFRQLKNIVEKHAPWSSAWVGEAGGAYHGGAYRISDTFINSFWYQFKFFFFLLLFLFLHFI